MYTSGNVEKLLKRPNVYIASHTIPNRAKFGPKNVGTLYNLQIALVQIIYR